MTFGDIAVRHAAGVSSYEDATPVALDDGN
jgi:hypothetical protein